jgi:hypothetical protein
VIAGTVGFGAISRAKKAHGAESRRREIRLGGKKLDEEWIPFMYEYNNNGDIIRGFYGRTPLASFV